MKHADFIAAVDDAHIVAAIQAAERITSAEFRVFVSHVEVHDPVEAAERQFARLNMHRTTHRNAILIFVAPKSRNFAIYADTAAHERCGQALFDQLAAGMRDRFKQQGYTEGLVHVIAELGQALSTSFPSIDGLGNELSDDVAR